MKLKSTIKQLLKLLSLKIKFLYKVKAGGLQLVIFVTVVVALLLSSFVLYVHLNSMYKVDNNNILNAVKLSDSGFEWVKTHNINYKDSVDLKISETEHLKIFKKHWGVLDLVNVKAKSQNKHYGKMALIGGNTPVNKKFALFVKNKNNPLVVVGNSNLKGDLFTSRYGIKAGNISGLYYENSELFKGNLNENEFDLNLELEKAVYMKSINDFYSVEGDLELKDIDTLSQSFHDAVAHFYSDEEIYLEDQHIYGHVVIQSEVSIEIDEFSYLEDVILIAPSITIKEGFKGSVQCFSSSQINIENNVELLYPSALVMNPKPFKKESVPKIIINEDVKVNGSLVYFKNQEQTNRYESNIFIGSNSTILGMIYSEQNLELHGDVKGGVITEQFITSYDNSTYINHLLNVSISSDFISEHQVGLVFDSKNLGISKWVY